MKMDNDRKLFLAFIKLQYSTARLLKTIDELARLYPYNNDINSKANVTTNKESIG
jgi:hypothetical protein